MPALLTGQFPLQSDREGSPGRREWVEAHRLLSNIAQENHSHMTHYSPKYFSILPKTCLLLWPSVWNKLLLPKSIFLGEAGTCIQFDMYVITAILTINVMSLWFIYYVPATFPVQFQLGAPPLYMCLLSPYIWSIKAKISQCKAIIKQSAYGVPTHDKTHMKHIR